MSVKWVKTDKRMPKANRPVLVAVWEKRDGRKHPHWVITESRYLDTPWEKGWDAGYCEQRSYYDDREVRYWMPMPAAPPREESRVRMRGVDVST